ncbi:CAMK family protein kinase [Histomonas meleagridis]|uniref:CAMK family protein kinase n=1 Tax=Histomonas meleagridis TaxID=135588 RepID=UPI003559C1B0|nr:CAMK family protein kinase [Histomonas meleagridis]KAH0799413.1 CAMK family protein kinase [Histomonas meleagridis]
MGTCCSSNSKVRTPIEKAEVDEVNFVTHDAITSEFSIANEQVFTSINSTSSGGIAAVPSFFNPEIKPTIFEYEFVRHIGHGATSDVFLVKNTETGENFAAKVYDRGFLFRTSIGDTEQPIQKLLREAQIMSSIQDKNCLSLIEILEDDVTNSITLIIPFADAGSLSKYSYKADPLDEETAKDVFHQIASGIHCIHSMNIIHRDLKPDNILKFSDGRVVIADFSVSIVLEDENELLEDTDGTPAFYSPEECLGIPYLGKPADIWAFGMIMYVMIYGKLPFFDFDDENIFFSQFFEISQRIINDEFVYPQTIPISSELKDLLTHILEKDPKKRYTIEQILNHEWFKDVNT